jgi:undecaprenyl phosphate-alpha-L-ara4N flippase subunit ArnE
MIGILFVLGGVVFESLGQAIFKRATHRVRHGDTTIKSFRRMFKNWPLIVGGIVLCLTNNICYSLGLYHLPLSLAFPLESLELVMMAILSRLWLNETVGRRRWLAICLILAGAVLVSAPGA